MAVALRDGGDQEVDGAERCPSGLEVRGELAGLLAGLPVHREGREGPEHVSGLRELLATDPMGPGQDLRSRRRGDDLRLPRGLELAGLPHPGRIVPEPGEERLVRVRRRTTSLKLSPSPFTAARARYASSERVTVFTDMSVLISTHGNK